jgi:biopolymer transport protein ExbD
MFKPKLLRLIIYLVVSIGLIILLLNTPTVYVTNPKKEIKKVYDSVQIIELPKKHESSKIKDEFSFQIDSSNSFIHKSDTLKLDELLSAISEQKQKRPKLILLITVHPRSKSELLMSVIEFAKREKIKIGITKN